MFVVGYSVFDKKGKLIFEGEIEENVAYLTYLLHGAGSLLRS
jgi:hypothetical protein